MELTDINLNASVYETSGVYLILNTKTNEGYIGSSVNMHVRCLAILKGRSNYKLKDAISKFKRENFKLICLQTTHRDNLIRRERYWQLKLRPEYNLKYEGDPMPEDCRNKISIKNTGKRQSEELKAARSKKMKGNKFAVGLKHSKEFIEKMRQIHIGKPKTEEHKEKIRQSHLKRRLA